MKRVYTEIEFMKKCKNPYVVQFYESFEVEKTLWVVMEYCQGGSIQDTMKVTNKALTENQISSICSGVLQGLSFLHFNNIIHNINNTINYITAD